MAERLGWLLDPGSFTPHGETGDSELIGGTGTIDGRRVCVIAINPEATRKTDPFDVLQQELALLDLAETEHLPVIHLADRPGRVAMETTAIPFAILQTFIDPRVPAGSLPVSRNSPASSRGSRSCSARSRRPSPIPLRSATRS